MNLFIEIFNKEDILHCNIFISFIYKNDSIFENVTDLYIHFKVVWQVFICLENVLPIKKVDNTISTCTNWEEYVVTATNEIAKETL